jgi:hypothetical protein
MTSVHTVAHDTNSCAWCNRKKRASGPRCSVPQCTQILSGTSAKKEEKKKKYASEKSSSISNPIYIEMKKENCTLFTVIYFPNTSVEELYLLGYNAV